MFSSSAAVSANVDGCQACLVLKRIEMLMPPGLAGQQLLRVASKVSLPRDVTRPWSGNHPSANVAAIASDLTEAIAANLPDCSTLFSA